MRPPRQSQTEFERIGDFAKYDEWIPGKILDISLREDHLTGFKDEKTGKEKRADQVRFKFELKGAAYPHYSRWITYSYGEKANLFLKYLKHLVEGAQPDFSFDIEDLKEFQVKTMWSANGDFDNIDQVRPLGAKLINRSSQKDAEPDDPAEEVADSPEVGE